MKSKLTKENIDLDGYSFPCGEWEEAEIKDYEAVIEWNVDVQQRSTDVIITPNIVKAELTITADVATGVFDGDGYYTPREEVYDEREDVITVDPARWKIVLCYDSHGESAEPNIFYIQDIWIDVKAMKIQLNF